MQVIRLYDYEFKGCISCFACQMKNHREELQCWYKDSITHLLKDTRNADGIVFASPIYYMNVSAQLRLFWERLQYPGSSARTVPTALLYTMNAPEEAYIKMMKGALDINEWYLDMCFHEKPELVNSYNTFQYNDNDIYIDRFRAPAKDKWQHHVEQFGMDLENARQAGARLVERIRQASK